MKKTFSYLALTILIYIIFFENISGQPVLTANGIMPTIGDNYSIVISNYFNEGSSGANQTWDFTSASNNSEQPYNCITSASTPYASSFPNSNIATIAVGENSYAYYESTTSEWLQWGAVSSTGISIIYSNPEKLLNFPFAYNNTYTDTWKSSFVNASMQYYRKGTTTVTADAYGILKTPSGTFNNVLRLHMLQVYSDSVYYSGMSYIINYQNDEYLWYANSYKNALAFTTSFTSDLSSTQQSGYLLTSSSNISENDNKSQNINIFPNPVVDEINIAFKDKTSNDIIIRIYNNFGKLILNKKVESSFLGTVKLNVTDYKSGIYFIQICKNGILFNSNKFVKM